MDHVRRQNNRTAWRSPEACFQAVTDLIAQLEAGGHGLAVAELRAGFGCLNGLTDGWALFLEAIVRVQATYAQQWDRSEQQALATLRRAVHTAMYRR